MHIYLRVYLSSGLVHTTGAYCMYNTYTSGISNGVHELCVVVCVCWSFLC